MPLSPFNMVASHLQKTYAQILFIDDSSAFNMMQVHVLLQWLLDRGEWRACALGQGLFNGPPIKSLCKRGTF